MSTVQDSPATTLTEAGIQNFVLEFYRQADNSAPLIWFLQWIEDDLHMVMTETCQFYGPLGFEEFYRNLTVSQFDRLHELSNFNITTDGRTAELTFTIHLTARMWAPPLPKSLHSENFANFRWTMRVSEKTGRPVIVDYQLVSIHFPEGSVVVDADKLWKYPTFMYGPFDLPFKAPQQAT